MHLMQFYVFKLNCEVFHVSVSYQRYISCIENHNWISNMQLLCQHFILKLKEKKMLLQQQDT